MVPSFCWSIKLGWEASYGTRFSPKAMPLQILLGFNTDSASSVDQCTSDTTYVRTPLPLWTSTPHIIFVDKVRRFRRLLGCRVPGSWAGGLFVTYDKE